MLSLLSFNKNMFTVLCDSRVWVLDRRVFQQIMMRTGMQKIEENVNFLRSVPLLKHLSNNLLAKIADVLEVVISIRRTRKKQQEKFNENVYY